MSKCHVHSFTFDFKRKTTKKARERWRTTHLYRQPEAGPHLLDHLNCDKMTGHLKNFLRIESEDFKFLLNKIGSKIMKKNTNMRAAIPVEKRLAVTLRCIAPFHNIYGKIKYGKLNFKNMPSSSC